MTNKTRIFVDATSKTVIHAIEEEHNTFQRTVEGLPPLKRITHISRSQLKQGSRQQSSGDDVFNSFMDDGNFVEVDQDSLLVRKKFSDQEIDKLADHLTFVLGLSTSKNANYLRNALKLMEAGQLAYENVETCQATPEPESLPEPEIDETHVAIIRRVAGIAIQEFEEEGIVDWKSRDSMVAKLRTTVRRRLRKELGDFHQAVVNREIGTLLTTQQPA